LQVKDNPKAPTASKAVGAFLFARHDGQSRYCGRKRHLGQEVDNLNCKGDTGKTAGLERSNN
jgi:hypothetical protein